jgi:hypothetical protein
MMNHTSKMDAIRLRSPHLDHPSESTPDQTVAFGAVSFSPKMLVVGAPPAGRMFVSV